MNTIRSILLAAVYVGAALAPAVAQETTEPLADVTQIPVRAAEAQPAVGELVVDQNGVIASPLFEENRICTVNGCRVFIFDKRSGALIHNDGVWSEAYARTGRGDQAIRVKNFDPAEAPQPAPSDVPLESAPAVTEVLRPQEKTSP